MSSLRRLEREVVRNQCKKRNGNTKAFHEAWEDYHYKRSEVVDAEGNVEVVRQKKGRAGKKKQQHFNGKQLIQRLQMFKQLVSQTRAEKYAKDTANADSKEN